MAATSGYTSVLLRQHASLVEPLHRQHANPDDTNSAVEIYLQVGRDVRPRSMLLELAAQVIKDPNPNPNPNPSPNPSPNPNPNPNPNPYLHEGEGEEQLDRAVEALRRVDHAHACHQGERVEPHEEPNIAVVLSARAPG